MTKQTLIVAFDTETTGIDKATDHVVQLASVIYPEGNSAVAATFESLANPGKPIPSDAAAVHGISDQQVADKPSSMEVVHTWWRHVNELAAEYDANIVLVAHNAPFDVPMVQKYFGEGWPGVPVVCILKTARRVDPLAQNHKLTTLVAHHHKLDNELYKKAHDALADVWMASMLLEHYLKSLKLSAMDLANWLNELQLLKIVPFGKHKGLPFDKIPPGSLRWFTNQPGMDADIVHTARTYLRTHGQ